MTLGTATGTSSTFLGLAPGDWATYLASGVAVLAAILAWIQAKRATRQTTYGTTASLMQDMNRIFITSPELRPIFFEQGTVPADADSQQKVKAITSYVLNVYEGIWSFAPHMGNSERDAWRIYISGELRNRPVLKEKFEAQPSLYPNLVKATKPPRYRPFSTIASKIRCK